MADIQRAYNIYQQEGFVGDLARPEEYRLFEFDKQTAVEVKPGMGVYWDRSGSKWRLPTNPSNQLDVIGMVSYDNAEVAGSLTSVPAGSNSGQDFKIAANKIVKIGTAGAFYAIAGEALKPGDLVMYDWNDEDWIRYSVPQGDAFPTSPAPSAGDLFRFDDAASSLSNTLDLDGSTALTSALGGDLFRRVGSNWHKQLQSAGTQKKSVYAITSAEANGLVVLRFSPSILR